MKASKVKKKAAKSHPKTDRRVTQTRDALGDALVALMHEKRFDDITVQEVLDRAGIGRTTFYTHYRDKGDLLLSDVEDFLEHCLSALKRRDGSSERLLPVREFFTHIRDAHDFYAALVRSGKLNELQALARGLFARSIEERLLTSALEIDAMRRSAHAHALAGSFFSLLDWWIDKGMKADPEELDDLFHRMAWRGLEDRRK